MHESRAPISAEPTTMPTNAPSPLGISKGSGREPWHISQSSQGEIAGMGTPENAAQLIMQTQCPGHASSCTSFWGAPDLPASPCWSNCELCIASAGSLVQGCGWACKTLCKGLCCTELLLWGLLLAGKVYIGQGARVGGWKQLYEDRRVSRWAEKAELYSPYLKMNIKSSSCIWNTRSQENASKNTWIMI